MNEIGQTQLSNRPSIIPAIFTIFTSERHLKVLIDKENAVIIGTAIDELVRHHPLLKAAVFTSLKSTLGAIEEIGRNYRVPNDLLHWYQLVPATTVSVDTDVKMEDAEPVQAKSAEADIFDVTTGDIDEATSKTHDNTVVSFIDVLCRVCFSKMFGLYACLRNPSVPRRLFPAWTALQGFYYPFRWPHVHWTPDSSTMPAL